VRHIAVSDASRRAKERSEHEWRESRGLAAPRRVLLCIDVSNHVYKAAAAHPMLTSRRVFTGGLYGFFAAFGKIVRETQATHVAFCRDTKPYLRSETYPEYKKLRAANADDDLLKMYKQSLSLVEEVFEACGINAWAVKGFEADDLVGHCVMKYRHRFDRIYAASNDSDLWQLLWCDNFFIYRKSIADVVTGKWLWDHHELTPEQHMLATALRGTHNDVEGIKGVGEVTAFKAVKDPALLRTLRDKHGWMIERNLGLIKLPHAQLPRSLAIPDHREFKPRELYKALGKYDIDVTGSMVSALEQTLGDRR
jgi:5'-3' exonuclease